LSSPALAIQSVQYQDTGPGPQGGMTIDLLIHAIVRQTTILIAQLATSRGLRAPLAQIANQVFLDLVAELERQRVSRRVSADMFGLGLRTYRRKIQRLSESATDRGRSLWEVVLEYIRARSSATRVEILKRFSGDEESQVKAVLHDLCESQLVVASGSGGTATYRAARGEELLALQQGRGAEGLDELVLALMFREAPLTVDEIARQATLEVEKVEPIVNRLLREGRIERTEHDGAALYQATRLLVPLGATAGWEAAIFDHYKALVTTLICRLRDRSGSPQLEDTVGGSTYTLSVWPGHPMADEVYGTMKRLRAEIGSMRERVAKHNQGCAVPDAHTRVVIYLGQSLINEGSEPTDHE
jgi:DNA-binding MarR family transcriptional regulator